MCFIEFKACFCIFCNVEGLKERTKSPCIMLPGLSIVFDVEYRDIIHGVPL